MEKTSCIKKLLIILLAFISIMIINAINLNKVYAANSSIEIKKFSYDETTNELVVSISVKANVKQYSFVLNYDTEKMEVITYYDGQETTGNIEDDISIINTAKLPIDINTSDCSEGRIEINSIEAADDRVTTKADEEICQIRFKLISDENILEEDIPTGLIEKEEDSVSIIKYVEFTDEELADAQESGSDATGRDEISYEMDEVAINEMRKYPSKIEVDEGYTLTKTRYEYGEEIDIQSGTATITYTNVGKYSPQTRQVDLETLEDANGNVIDIQKSGNWTATEDQQILKVSYRNVTSADAASMVAKVHIYVEDTELSQNSETVYWGDDENDLTTTVTPILSDGTRNPEESVTSYVNTSNVNFEKAGTYNTTVNYTYQDENEDGTTVNKTISKNFKITVLNPVQEITIEADELAKIETQYKYNQELNLKGAQISVRRLSGITKINLTKEMISNYDKQQLGDQTISIHYSLEGVNLDIDLEVNVEDYIADIKLIKPTKTTYMPDEELDLEGAMVQTVSASGILGEEVPVTFEMISGYNSNKFGAQKITVEYEGFKKEFNIIRVPQTGSSGINLYTVLIITLETSLIGITAILSIQKKQFINKNKNVNKL